jgi:hypothetical protein
MIKLGEFREIRLNLNKNLAVKFFGSLEATLSLRI